MLAKYLEKGIAEGSKMGIAHYPDLHQLHDPTAWGKLQKDAADKKAAQVKAQADALAKAAASKAAAGSSKKAGGSKAAGKGGKAVAAAKAKPPPDSPAAGTR